MRKIITILLLIISINGFCQDTTKQISISLDYLKAISREVVLGMQLDLKKNIFVDIQIGYMYSNKRFRRSTLKGLAYQNDNPIFLFKGPTFRSGLFWYVRLNKRTSNRFYIGPQFDFMYIGYKNKELYDYCNRQDHYFTRSEDTKVIGGVVLMGFTFSMDKNDILNSNFFFGIGRRYKYRHYTTTETSTPYYAPLGEYNELKKITAWIFGYRIIIKI